MILVVVYCNYVAYDLYCNMMGYLMCYLLCPVFGEWYGPTSPDWPNLG